METSIDRIESHLRAEKHTTWGFIIYRSTYTSDEDFASFISSIKTSTSENMKDYGIDFDGSLIARHLSWKIIEDRSRLDGALKTDIRRMFDEWCRSSEAAAGQPGSVYPVADSRNARYRFCVLVDPASIDSLKNEREPWVNVVMRGWPYGSQECGDGDDEDEDEGDDDLEEIEESIEEDVGWCKVRVSSLLPGCFSTLCGPNAWYLVYQRPPLIAW